MNSIRVMCSVLVCSFVVMLLYNLCIVFLFFRSLRKSNMLSFHVRFEEY